MNRNRKGFTLIELTIVVLIMGILASISVPQYLKTVETSKATDAVGLVQMIASANRMYNVDNGAYAFGVINSSSHVLISNKYIADHEWGTATTGTPYYYYACNASGGGGGCCSGTAVACAKRKSGNYSGWGYRISSVGVCSTLTTDTPPCPGI